jgi:hypothetical protein
MACYDDVHILFCAFNSELPDRVRLGELTFPYQKIGGSSAIINLKLHNFGYSPIFSLTNAEFV